MEIVIEGTETEIATLVLEIQKQQKDIAIKCDGSCWKKISEIENILKKNKSIEKVMAESRMVYSVGQERMFRKYLQYNFGFFISLVMMGFIMIYGLFVK